MKKIVVLANHSLVLQPLEYLVSKKLLAGLALPNYYNDLTVRMASVTEKEKIPFLLLDPKEVEKNLIPWLLKIKPDVVFVITFPFKIPEKALKIPKFGFFNWHTGLLPKYRGADPVFWEILNQEPFGGVTINHMTPEMDAGPIVQIKPEEIPYDEKDPYDRNVKKLVKAKNGSLIVEILPEDTYGQHFQKLFPLVKKSVQFLVKKLSTDPKTIRLVKQNPEEIGSYKKPDSFEDLFIKWSEHKASHIKALVRASNPSYGGAITFFRGVRVHLLEASIGPDSPKNSKPGTIVSSGKQGLIVSTLDKVLRLDVMYTEDGFFSGPKLISAFSVNPKEAFLDPPTVK